MKHAKPPQLPSLAVREADTADAPLPQLLLVGNDVIADMLRPLIEGMSLHWCHTADLDRARQLLNADSFDLVLLDSDLPSWDVVYEQLRALWPCGALPLLWLNGHPADLAEITRQTLDLGGLDLYAADEVLLAQLDMAVYGARLLRVQARSKPVDTLRQRLGHVLENTSNEIYVFDAHSCRYLQWNDSALENLGYDAEDVVGLTPLDIVAGLSSESMEELLAPLRDGSSDHLRFNSRYIRRDGTSYPVEVTLHLSRDDERPVFVAICKDLSEREAAEAAVEALDLSERRYRTVFENTGTAVAVIDADGVFELVNRPFEKMMRSAAEDLIEQRSFHEFVAPAARDATRDFIQAARSEDADLQIGERHEFRFVDTRGRYGWGYLTAAPLPGSTSSVVSIVDISELKRTQASLQHLASHDVLTGLPNRMLFRDRLRRAMREAARQSQIAAVLMIDLDRFKNINDTLGHHWGDELLRIVADRIAACVRSTDTLSRLGGDEFGIVLQSLVHQRDAGRVAEKILLALRAPVELRGHRLFISASIGIAVHPHDGDTVDELQIDADVAMYQAKSTGKNGYRYYSKEMNSNARDQLDLENALRNAMDRGEFALVYQPQIDLPSGELCGVEALMRWRHPQRGFVPPDAFVPLLEETGLIVPVGEWVLEQACHQCRRWHAAGHLGLRVSVNLSARQVAAGLLPETVARVLDRSGLPPEFLELELTESLLMQDVKNTQKVLNELSAMGVRLSIDDFGTGYSSLAYLKRLPVHALKIDRSFVMDMVNDRDDLVIVQSTVDLGHNLGLQVVAEGVENEEVLQRLRELGCDFAQGYHLSRPLPAVALEQWMNGHSADLADQYSEGRA
jgi:diguanylate cyclase (GGDEF)-like protein/PAS domain S-box-containing protein